MAAPLIHDFYPAPDGHRYSFSAQVEDNGDGSYTLHNVAANSASASKQFGFADIVYTADESQMDNMGRAMICMAIDEAIKRGD